MNNSKLYKVVILSIMILTCALSRIAPHPANFTPITAMALFAAVYFEQASLALFVPLLSLIISDAVIGFSPISPVIYLVMSLIAGGGLVLRKRFSITPLFITLAGSSLFFFITTNFAVWVLYDMYPKTFEGVIACYISAIPFYRNMAAGDIIYSAVLFGGYQLAIRPLFLQQKAV